MVCTLPEDKTLSVCQNLGTDLLTCIIDVVLGSSAHSVSLQFGWGYHENTIVEHTTVLYHTISIVQGKHTDNMNYVDNLDQACMIAEHTTDIRIVKGNHQANIFFQAGFLWVYHVDYEKLLGYPMGTLQGTSSSPRSKDVQGTNGSTQWIDGFIDCRGENLGFIQAIVTPSSFGNSYIINKKSMNIQFLTIAQKKHIYLFQIVPVRQ